MQLHEYIKEIEIQNSSKLTVNKDLEVESYLFDADIIGESMRDLHVALNPLRMYKDKGNEKHYEQKKEGQLIIGKVKVGGKFSKTLTISSISLSLSL